MRRQPGEGSLYRRSRGRQWVAVCDLGTGKDGQRDRREFTGPTAQAAIDKRKDFLTDRANGFTPQRGPAGSFAAYLEQWLEVTARRKVEVTTYPGYCQKVRDHVAPSFGQPIGEVTADDVEAWHAKLEAKGLSRSTVAQCHAIASACMNVAVARGRSPRNPFSLVTPPKVVKHAPVLPTRAELAGILSAAPPRWILAISAGLRQGEVLALRWSDVDLTAGRITVRQSAARVQGELVVKAPKSDASRRTVDLPPQMVTMLREHRKQQMTNLSSDLVFTAADGSPIHPRTDRREWHQLLADLAVTDCRVHDLRHLCATLLLEEGVDIKTVQGQLGHAKASFTQDTYQHVTERLRAQAASAIGGALWPQAN